MNRHIIEHLKSPSSRLGPIPTQSHSTLRREARSIRPSRTSPTSAFLVNLIRRGAGPESSAKAWKAGSILYGKSGQNVAPALPRTEARSSFGQRPPSSQETLVLPPNPESALVRSDNLRLKLGSSGESFFDAIYQRAKDRACGIRSTSCAATRLRALVMSISNGSLSHAAADPTLMSRIEAHVSESGDAELQQFLNECLLDI